jgi:hypothetical protein
MYTSYGGPLQAYGIVMYEKNLKVYYGLTQCMAVARGHYP